MSDDDGNGSPVSRRELGNELKAFRAETRLLILGSLAANQILIHVGGLGIVTGALTGALGAGSWFLAGRH